MPSVAAMGIHLPQSTITGNVKNSANVGSVPSASIALGVTAVEISADGYNRTTLLTLVDVPITITDSGGANGGHGGIQIYDFPEGGIGYVGGSVSLTTLAGSGGITDTSAMIGSVGSVVVATNNATLTTTEADFIPSANCNLTGGAGALAVVSTTALIATFDGSSTAVDAFLNFIAADAGISANDTLTVNGTILLRWTFLGDI